MEAAVKHKSKPIASWSQWFDRCAQYYKDPRMKMAYYDGGKPVKMSVMRNIRDDVWNKLEARSRSVVLDVGGGIGLFSQAFQHRVNRIIGTDISPAMIQGASQLNPQGTFLLCEAAFLPFSSRCFDRVLCYSVFHYLKDLSHAKKVLDEFMRVVTKDGLILIGDVLYPLNSSKQNAQSASRKSNTKAPDTVWWPSSLSHNLKKLTFDPLFFLDYGKKNGHPCRILKQDIPGKTTAASRYDVAIRF